MAQSPNKIAGVWRLVSAVVDPDGQAVAAFGPEPDGLLSFDDTGHFVEVLHDRSVPAFAAGTRDGGSPEENLAAVIGVLGQFGTYTVDADGDFAGNTIVGSSFPNWNGLHRDHPQLSLRVDGNRLIEELRDPGQPEVRVLFERVT